MLSNECYLKGAKIVVAWIHLLLLQSFHFRLKNYSLFTRINAECLSVWQLLSPMAYNYRPLLNICRWKEPLAPTLWCKLSFILRLVDTKFVCFRLPTPQTARLCAWESTFRMPFTSQSWLISNKRYISEIAVVGFRNGIWALTKIIKRASNKSLSTALQ